MKDLQNGSPPIAVENLTVACKHHRPYGVGIKLWLYPPNVGTYRKAQTRLEDPWNLET